MELRKLRLAGVSLRSQGQPALGRAVFTVAAARCPQGFITYLQKTACARRTTRNNFPLGKDCQLLLTHTQNEFAVFYANVY